VQANDYGELEGERAQVPDYVDGADSVYWRWRRGPWWQAVALVRRGLGNPELGAI